MDSVRLRRLVCTNDDVQAATVGVCAYRAFGFGRGRARGSGEQAVVKGAALGKREDIV